MYALFPIGQTRPVRRKIYQSAIANINIYRDEVADVLMDVLLHGVAPIDTSTDLAEYLVPRAPDLCAQEATQRGQVLVEGTITIARTLTESHRPIDVITESSGGRISTFPAARSLDDHFVHILAHGELRKTKSPRQNPLPGAYVPRETRTNPIGFG